MPRCFRERCITELSQNTGALPRADARVRITSLPFRFVTNVSILHIYSPPPPTEDHAVTNTTTGAPEECNTGFDKIMIDPLTNLGVRIEGT